MYPRRSPRSASQAATTCGRRRRWSCRWSYRWSWALACSAVALACTSDGLGTKAWGQAQRSDNPAPAGPSFLTVDWGGLRSNLERQGVTVTLNYTSDFLANVSGGIKTGAVGLGAFLPQVD